MTKIKTYPCKPFMGEGWDGGAPRASSALRSGRPRSQCGAPHNPFMGEGWYEGVADVQPASRRRREPAIASPKSGMNRERQIPSPFMGCRGRFEVSRCKTTFTPSGGGASRPSSEGGSASPSQAEARSRYGCAQAPLSAATAARPDSFSAPERPSPGCRRRASAAPPPPKPAGCAPPARGLSDGFYATAGPRS